MKIIPGLTTKLEEFLCHFLPLAKLLKIYYEPIVKREIALGKINKNDKVLCIGGGAVPWTAIEIVSQTGATVHVIDYDQKAVEAARGFLKQLNLENKITVLVGDGRTVDVSPYSVAHVALQAYPQEKILHHLLEKGKSNTRILVRCPKEGISCLYGSTCSSKNCFVNCSTKQTFSTMKATVLFVKSPKRGDASNEKEFILSSRNTADLSLTVES